MGECSDEGSTFSTCPYGSFSSAHGIMRSTTPGLPIRCSTKRWGVLMRFCWITSLLNTSGREYAVLDGEQLVGVIGLLLPTYNHREVVITNLAVNPGLRRNGIGTRIIRQLPQVISLRPDMGWLAYVHERNLAARCFFEQNGWRAMGNNPPEDKMILYSSRGYAETYALAGE